MIKGVQWSALWYRQGELVYFETKPWDGSTGGYGYTDWNPAASEWLAGQYEVQIFVGHQFIVSGFFTVEGQPPAPPASATPTRTSLPTSSFTPTLTRQPTSTPSPVITVIPSQTPVPPTPRPSLTPTPQNTHQPTFTPGTITPTGTHFPTYTPSATSPTATHFPTLTPPPKP
jgi:hypothetical protein